MQSDCKEPSIEPDALINSINDYYLVAMISLGMQQDRRCMGPALNL